jgi:hypothetical protein
VPGQVNHGTEISAGPSHLELDFHFA